MKINLSAEIDTDNEDDRQLVEDIMEIVQLVKDKFVEDASQ